MEAERAEIAEIGNAASYARHLYAILGRGAIGVAPFGIDYFNYSNYPLGSPATNREMVEPFARVYRAFEPVQGLWAQWAFEGRTRGAAEGDDRRPQTLDFPGWVARLSYREWQFGDRNDTMPSPPGTDKPGGGVAIAQIADDEFLILGQRTRVRIEPAAGTNGFMLRAEQGRFDAQGRWLMERVWNGDQVDYGLNLPAEPVMLKVRMGRPR